MDDEKQLLFMERVLALHKVALKRRSGKATSVRLTLKQWITECNAMAALCHVLVEMTKQPSTFSQDKLIAARTRVLEGCLSIISGITAVQPLNKTR